MFRKKTPPIPNFTIEISVNSMYCRISTNIGEIISTYYLNFQEDKARVGIFDLQASNPDEMARLKLLLDKIDSQQKLLKQEKDKNTAFFNLIKRYLNNGLFKHDFVQLIPSHDLTTIVINNWDSLNNNKFYDYLNNLFIEMLSENVISRDLLEQCNIPFYKASLPKLHH